MTEEAGLRRVGSGLVAEREGWFMVNAREAAWTQRETFGFRCSFAADGPALRGVETDLEPWTFSQLGITLAVLPPGDRSTIYHAEDAQQEDFLVLAGRCTAVLEEEEREVSQWDFVHCPPGTRHVFVNTSDAPCVLLMVGARSDPDYGIVYPASDVAGRYGAAVETTTTSAHEAYAPYPHWRNAGEPNPGKL